ncbi:MAG: LuxR C-terminal-related transcriptional regulator [Nocardioides sp.]
MTAPSQPLPTLTARLDDLPRLPRVYVPRPRLWERLDRGAESSLTMLVGPVGAGKSLGASGWLRDRGIGRARWVQARPDLEPEALLELVASTHDDDDAGSQPGLLVLDDAHLLPAASIQVLDRLVNDDPDRMRVLLLTRWDLGITRLAAELRGHLTILRGELLRLDEQESAALVAEHSRSADPQVASIVSDRTRGWCGAVVLTARAIGAAPDAVAAAERLGAAHTVVADAVASEVFAALHPRERHLLLCVAGDPVVSVDTAVMLTRDPRCGAILDDLDTTGLLVSRLGGDDDAVTGSARYRIHPLLAEVVRRRLAAGGVDVEQARGTVLRAVRADLARGEILASFDRLLAVEHVEAAADLLHLHGEALLDHGGGSSLQGFVRHHPEALEDRPAAWFTVALERWQSDDVHGALGWIEQLLREDGRCEDTLVGEVACARLMRARLGFDSLTEAVAHARQLVADGVFAEKSGHLLPRLLCELGTDQAWLGDLDAAEETLGEAIQLGRAAGLTTLVAAALTQLAFTLYMQGHERDAARTAARAEGTVGRQQPGGARSSAAHLARELGTMADLPWPAGLGEVEADHGQLHPADITAGFWARMRDARHALAAGSVMRAERILRSPADLPRLPRHLRIVVLVELAFLAALSSDEPGLETLARQLEELGAAGEAQLVLGLRADLRGNRRAASEHFVSATAHPLVPQPAVLPLALTCAAQMYDALGNRDQALVALQAAVTATEVRGNSVPFLGWTRQGAPLHPLLQRLAEHSSDSWARDLAVATARHPGVAAVLAPWTPSTRERAAAAAEEPVMRPDLSPRERDVLHELARGSTYADIAASLFVSENTVKTHVSSLYGKLAVNRRSEALAVARNFDLL